MASPSDPSQDTPVRLIGYTALAALGLAAASASAWVHYRILNDPAYTSFCDVNATFSCTEAYSSRFGAFGGVPVAVFGMIFFAFVLVLVALCSRSLSAVQNLPGYIFGSSTIGLAVVLYLAYASFVILKAVCVLCVGSYAAVIGLFLLSGSATRYPMTSLPNRVLGDLRLLLRTPLALAAAAAFVVAAGAAVAWFSGQSVATVSAEAATALSEQAATPVLTADQITEFEAKLAQQPRLPLVVPAEGAAVVIVKFNDYQCPPCRQTYMDYKAVFAKWAKQNPGKVRYVTRDYPLERQCNANVSQDLHPSACEAAVAVRLAREKGKAEAMEEWVFANQPSLTPESVKAAVASVAGVTDFDARFAATLELVKADIAQGAGLKVSGTPTFFINGMRLPGLPAEYFDAAIAWEAAAGHQREVMAPAIETEGLSKDFSVGFWRPRPYRALDQLTLRVDAGEVFGFLGPNGAGKSTTLKLLMQLLYPTSGTARILGRPVGDVAIRQRIGFLAENPYYYDYLTAEELLTYFARLFGLTGADVTRRVSNVLDDVGLGSERRMRLRRFSKGMIQRVGLAQALLNEPDVLFLDEPMSGLDPLGRRHVRDLILKLRARGCTVFFSSHILSDAESLCSRVGVLVQGRLVASGPLSQVLALELRGWELVISNVSTALSPDLARLARQVTMLNDDHVMLHLAADAEPDRLLGELTVRGAHIVSLNPGRETLEDYFMKVVESAEARDSRGVGA